MRQLYFIFILIYYSGINLVFAQGEANIWYFGTNAGLDFNSGNPIAITDGQSTAWEGTAVMSDSAGNLLFYTDGVTVWNRNHDTLLNGSGLLGDYSSTQSALIIPKPGSLNRYYIFTTQSVENMPLPIPSDAWKLCYSELNMNLDGGLGGITSTKNVVLNYPVQEKLTAVRHANNQDVWVLAHDMFTNKYLSYWIKPSGVDTIPIVSETGTIDDFVNASGFPLSTGYMVASNDGGKIAAAFGYAGMVDVLDFNKANGLFTLKHTLTLQRVYGLAFSPNAKLLYASPDFPVTIQQYNIELNNTTEVMNSSVSVFSNQGFANYALQLAPNGKIYGVSFGRTSMHCIDSPNTLGIGCNFLFDHVSLNNKESRLGLPNVFSNYYFENQINYSGICLGESITFSVNHSTQPDSIVWNFGNPSTGNQNNAQGDTVAHIYNEEGVYWVNALVYNGSNIDTLTTYMYIIAAPSFDLGDNRSICPDDSVLLFPQTASQLLWQDGSVGESYLVTAPGNYWATASNHCGIFSDSVRVENGPNRLSFISVSECESVSINGIAYNQSGIYTQTLESVSGCDSVLTIEANILNLNALISQNETSLFFNGNPTSIKWINCTTGQAIPGATQTSFTPQVSGNYGAVITIGECSDTSNCRQIIKSSTSEKPGSFCDNLIVSPNPVNDQIEFTLDKSVYDIRLFTSAGALLISAKGDSEKQIINFRELAPAMYVLQVDECRYKIVKQ